MSCLFLLTFAETKQLSILRNCGIIQKTFDGHLLCARHCPSP